MSLDELKKYAASRKIPLGTVEKDYVLSVVLSQFSKSHHPSKLIFKGGTAIKKVYFPDTRFSVDLDFNFFDLSGDEVVNEVTKLFGRRSILRVNFEEVKTENLTEDKVLLRLKYKAQMNHSDSIRFDFVSEEPLLATPHRWTLRDDYDVSRRMTCEHLAATSIRRDTLELQYSCALGRMSGYPSTRIACLDCKMEAPRKKEMLASAFRVMSPEEITSEKIRACLTRGLPRDLYDVWFLRSKGIKILTDMVIEKLGHFKEFREAIPSLGDIREQLKPMKQEWDRDLGDLVPLKTYPTFEEALEQLTSGLKESDWKD